MLISLLILLLSTNAVTQRRNKSILYSRIVMKTLLFTSFLTYENLYLAPLGKGIGIFGGLFNITSFTHSFNIFILIITTIILTLTAFYPRKIFIKEYFSMYCLKQYLSYKTITIFIIIFVFYRIPLKFMFNQLNISLGYLVFLPFITVLSYIFNCCINDQQVNKKKGFYIFVFSCFCSMLIFFICSIYEWYYIEPALTYTYTLFSTIFFLTRDPITLKDLPSKEEWFNIIIIFTLLLFLPSKI